MATQLKNIVRFVNAAVGVPTVLPHGLNIDDRAVVPDLVQAAGDFTVTADATNVTVTNNGTLTASIDVLVEHWYSPERAFGIDGTLALVPQPLVIVGQPTAGSAADFNYFGDGSDGDIILGAPLTMTRDMKYNNLLTQGFAVDTNGFRLFVRDTLTMGAASIMSNNGADGVAGVAGAAGAAGTLAGGAAGGAGSIGGAGAGAAGTGTAAAAHLANVAAGAGGAGDAGGGAGGVATALTAAQTRPNTLPEAALMRAFGITPIAMTGSGGGGGGSGTAAGAGVGGGGGGGGGLVMVAARLISMNATARIQANGGNGGFGTVGGTPGGGGGGGGGAVSLIYHTFVEVGTQIEADGGAPGLGFGAGAPGVIGADGTIWRYDVSV